MATVQIVCSNCGDHLKVYYDNERLEVVPCLPCEDRRKRLAYEKGWREGVEKYRREESDGEDNCDTN